DGADKQEFLHAGEITFGGAGNGCHRAKDRGGTAKGQHDQLCAITHAQDKAQQAGQHDAHEEGESHQQGDTQRAVLVLFDQEHQAKGTDQENNGAQAWAGAHNPVNAGGQAQQGSQHSGNHGQGQQPVGVAQDAIASNQRLGAQGAVMLRQA
uniref:Circumsporozoite protein n=1 Tax=Steinernema glaseri TaxID=37863 RepID=A0A1I8ANY6_9BILA